MASLVESLQGFDTVYTVADEKKGGSDGLTVQDNAARNAPVVRDAQGRWLPGQQPRGGRPPKRREEAVLDLMSTRIPPEKVVDRIEELIDDTASWRARAEGIKLYLAYMVGMPVQRSITATTRLATLIEQLGSMSEEQFQVVEGKLQGE